MEPDLEVKSEVVEAPEALRQLSAKAAVPAVVAQAPWWAPTLADFLFISLLVWLFLAGPQGWAALLSDGDTGWHIRVGDWIRTHNAFPRVDFLSFTKDGQPWFAWEWASEVLMSWLHSWAGLKGVVWGMGMLIPAYLLIGFRHAMWRGAEPLVALPILLVVSGSSAIHYLARPHLFTLVFLAAALWMIEADRRRQSAWIWALVPLTAVWTNLHGGFLALIACLGLVAAGSLIERRIDRGIRYGTVAAACLAASLVNPYGYDLHVHIVEYLRSDWIKEVVDEFQSPSFRSEAMFMYEAVLLASVFMAYRAVRRGEWVDTLLILGWAHFSLTSVRHVPIFLLIAAPVLTFELSALWRETSVGLSKRSISKTFATLSADLRPKFLANSIWILAPVVLLAFLDKPISWPKTFPEQRFPIEMIERHRAVFEGKKVLTTDEWGDYLSYRFYPKQRIFFDGRSDFYGPELGKDYLSLMRGAADSDARMQKFEFEAALLPLDWPLHLALRKHPQWRVLAEDKKVVVLVRELNRDSGAF